jgi:HK97 family phage major capsid protein
MNKFEQEKMDVDLQFRSLQEQVKAGSVPAVEARKAFEELRGKKAEIEQAQALATAPKIETRSTEQSDLQKALLEKRAITLGANGDTGFSAKLFEEAQTSNEILSAITIENGALPNTKFTLFSPTVNNVKRVAEDGTGATASTAAFAPVSVTPAPYLGYVNVTDYFLKFSPAGLQGKLTGLFGKAFARQMAKEVIIGDGSDEMLGLFNDTGITANVTCAAAGAPKLKDLLNLVAKLTGKFSRSQLAIVINPTFWASIMGEDTKWSYINNNADYFTFNGVRVIETDDAPTTVTAGSKVAMVGYLGDYGVGVATDVEVESLGKTAGSLNTPIQGTAYFDGKVIVPSSFVVLKTV